MKDHLPPWTSVVQRWEGNAKKGQTVLLTAEQGFGETIQFVRFAAMAAQAGANVIVQCQAELVCLLRSNREFGQVISLTEVC